MADFLARLLGIMAGIAISFAILYLALVQFPKLHNSSFWVFFRRGHPPDK
jgi:uncharacterized membrane protein YccC